MAHVLFCFVLFALQLSVCLWWHDYRRDGFPTLKFGVVMADLLQGSRYPLGVFGSRSELATTRRIRGGSEGRKNVGAKIGLEAVGGRSSVQCATERQDGGLGPAGSALLYDQGEFFRIHPVSGPSLCRGGRHRRL